MAIKVNRKWKKKHNIWNNIYFSSSGGRAETLRKQFAVWLLRGERLRLSLVPIMYFSAAPVCVFSADLPTQALPLLLHSKLQARWPQSIVSFVITFRHFFFWAYKITFLRVF